MNEATLRQQAIGIAQQFLPALGPALDVASVQLESYRTLVRALVALQQAEHDAARMGRALETLSTLGIASEHDFLAYDIIRANVFNTDLSVFRLLRNAVARIDSAKAKMLPAPRLLPALGRPTQMWMLREPYPLPPYVPPASGMTAEVRAAVTSAAASTAASTAAGAESTFDSDVFDVESARTMAPVLWAAAVLVVLVALAVIVAAGALVVVTATEEIARIIALKEQTAQYKLLLERRLEAYRACMAREDADDETCRAEVGLLVPTLNEAGFVSPVTDTSIYKMVPWAVGAVALGAGVWIFAGSDIVQALKRNERKVRRKALQGATTTPPKPQTKPKQKKRAQKQIAGPKEVNDLDGPSTYNLEVEE